MIVICAWCKSLIRLVKGASGVSHGLCSICKEDYFPATKENYDFMWVDIGGES